MTDYEIFICIEYEMVSSIEYKKQYTEHSEQFICYLLFYTYRYDFQPPPPLRKARTL